MPRGVVSVGIKQRRRALEKKGEKILGRDGRMTAGEAVTGLLTIERTLNSMCPSILVEISHFSSNPPYHRPAVARLKQVSTLASTPSDDFLFWKDRYLQSALGCKLREIDEKTLKKNRGSYEVNPSRQSSYNSHQYEYAKYPDFYATLFPTFFDYYGPSTPMPLSVPPPVPGHGHPHPHPHPHHPHHPPARRSPFQALKTKQEIAWVVVVIQTIVIVALSLLFFTYVIYNTQPSKPMQTDSYHGSESHEINRTSLIMRKHPRLGHSWENSIDTNVNGVEVSIDLIDDRKGLSTTSAERLPLKTAVVISNDKRCSDIGNAILVRGGNAADAAIAALFCLGVTQPQASGLGGGLMGLFCEKGGRCTEINARETAPSASTKDMFISNPRDSSEGYRAIAVPGELNGLWRMHERFGSHRISWHDLVWPSVEMARKGVRVGADLASTIQLKHRSLFEEETLRSLLINPRTAELYKEGETMQRDLLAETLQQIAEADDPVELFYKEEMGEQIVKEIRKGGGIITKLDFEDYESVLSPALCTSFHPSISLCGPRPPSSFLITQLIVATMNALYPSNFSDEDLKAIQFTHRFIEASKFAFAQRVALGDPAFTVNSDYMVADHGTSHVSVIDEFGNGIAVSSSINTPFGSLRASRLGFIYNSQMDAFSMPNVPSEFGFPPSEANYIQPGKCPMSSLSPVIAVNRETGQSILSAGGIGGTRIVPSMASLLTRSLFFERPLAESAQQKLIFSQYIPDNAFFEQGFDRDLLHQLSDRGHQVRQMADSRFSVFGVSRSTWGVLQTTNDFRSVDGGHTGY